MISEQIQIAQVIIMGWVNNPWIIGIVTNIIGGLILMFIVPYIVKRRRPSRGNATRMLRLQYLLMGIIVTTTAIFVYWSQVDPPPQVDPPAPSGIEFSSDTRSQEKVFSEPESASVGNGNQTAGDDTLPEKINCHVLERDLSEIAIITDRDATIRRIISRLLDNAQHVNDATKTSYLQCAGSLAKLSQVIDNRDREIARVIDANLKLGQCDTARKLTEYLSIVDSISEQKAKVAQQCLGQD